MTDLELQRDSKTFFSKHALGIELKRRWENRVTNYLTQLTNEKDMEEVHRLQAKIQYHREVLLELGL